jgi:phosphatidylglycerophosphate synthase
MTTGRILNIPNILTLARIALIPVFLLVAYWPPVMGIAEQAVLFMQDFINSTGHHFAQTGDSG